MVDELYGDKEQKDDEGVDEPHIPIKFSEVLQKLNFLIKHIMAKLNQFNSKYESYGRGCIFWAYCHATSFWTLGSL